MSMWRNAVKVMRGELAYAILRERFWGALGSKLAWTEWVVFNRSRWWHGARCPPGDRSSRRFLTSAAAYLRIRAGCSLYRARGAGAGEPSAEEEDQRDRDHRMTSWLGLAGVPPNGNSLPAWSLNVLAVAQPDATLGEELKLRLNSVLELPTIA